MEQIAGKIRSKKTGIVYSVKWEPATRYAWFRKTELEGWTLAYTDVLSVEDAVTCAQRYIDGQAEVY